jgi:hypothetical protein
LIVAGLWLGAGNLPAQDPGPREYQIKAAFLLNFAHFTEWPAAAFATAGAPLVIGVLGEDPFGTQLDAVLQGEKANNRPLAVRRYARVEEIADCHILFVSRSESARLEQIFARLKDRSILTVGDSEGFALRGGMIRFATQNNRMHLRVNVTATKAAGLVISSQLLRAVEVVAPGKD